MDNMKNAILEGEGVTVVNDSCASSLPGGTVTRTIGKTTYIVNLHFKSQGKTAKSILVSCGARLACFDIEQVREVMSYDELERTKKESEDLMKQIDLPEESEKSMSHRHKDA